MKRLLIVIVLLASSSLVYADNNSQCVQGMAQLGQALTKDYSSQHSAFHTPAPPSWLTMNWLESKFGPASVRVLNKKVLQWPDLSMSVDNGRAIVTSITKTPQTQSFFKENSPFPRTNITLQQVTNVLGQPKQVTNTQYKTYQWRCVGGNGIISIRQQQKQVVFSVNYVDATHRLVGVVYGYNSIPGM